MPRPADIAPIDPLGMTHDRFVRACAEHGIKSGRAMDAYRACFKLGATDTPPASTTIPPIVRRLEEDADEGTTTKFVMRLDRPEDESRAHDTLGALAKDLRVEHLDIESVIIPMIGRTKKKTHTLCVSSQIGCAMGCGFCETAQMGLVRSLTPREIVAQWFAATHREHTHIDNIVFMGMGEPLDNLDNVLSAIACLTDHHGPAVPMSAITISTVGRVDGLRRLADVVQQPGWKRLGLALSLNASNDDVRNQIMPLNRKWGMDELRDTMIELMRVRGSRKILFEYVLIPAVNDHPDHARELAQWLAPFMRTENRGHVGLLNVIPYNPRRDSPWPAPDEANVKRFVDQLADLGVFVKRRRTKGRSTMAACGQLGTASIRKRKYVDLTTPATNEGHG